MYESISKNNELENEMTLDMSYFWYSDDNGQLFLIEKQFNLTKLKKSKSDNVMAVEEWKTDDDPSE